MSINWIKTERPERVLAKGTHKGFEYVVAHDGIGWRCGYIKVLYGHPWYAITWMGLEERCSVDAHGGVNYADYDDQEGYWVGFSCDHAGDRIDPDLAKDEPTKQRYMKRCLSYPEDYQLWTTEMVVDECKRLCEQAAVWTN